MAGSESPSILMRATGVICQERPNRSVSQPQGPISPPSPKRTVRRIFEFLKVEMPAQPCAHRFGYKKARNG